uniref:tetrabrachion n=1 Tax=Staphylothermus marinus TaxID=2280 RepID=UPI00004C2C8E|nr:Chain A, tetrabrachion [Staphylothermus marinus]1YBK_B Chain B, tetrabrachion [Staphylothermus marinus]1YBK_C Chain C, tetrabrachion [Staphylothermus marinus]1YBK_D Chain D, tetrabrachion [Staphylothermus marinus]5JR5_A Chain A, Tetrabrachion [Staphylothermus marinus]5JR5_B Chain B, Tetrabrachion [Staphylothermus marinus]5JR5_C Chain C, Tetrabrachion [Staphylothermus marinus]5JR5_D Chain D, Tetrabrachion [Staphylothermus marinus]5VH0_A Chain A, Tetrabrachion [Staphylothermus marinus]5VH
GSIINETADDIVYRLTVIIDDRYESLKNLITLRADRLEMIINDNVSTILASI